MKFGTVNALGDITMKTLSGNVLYVGPGCTYTTITLAMAAASAGDTILVAEGTYSEAVTFTQDNITLKAIGSKANTTITQTNVTGNGVVDFSTKSGCVLDGFTVSATAQTTTTKSTIYSNNNDASDYNYILNCDVFTTSSVNIVIPGTYIDDGNFEAVNCTFSSTNSASSHGYCHATQVVAAGHTAKFKNCKFISNGSSTGTNDVSGMWAGGSTKILFRDCDFEISSACTTTGNACGIIHHNTNSEVIFYDCFIDVNCTSTGLAYGIYNTDSGGGDDYLYNCTVKAIADTDGDGIDFIEDDAGEIFVYGGISLGDTLSSGTVTTLGIIRTGTTSAIIA